MVSASLLATALAVLAPNGPATPLATAKALSKAYANSIATKNAAWLEKNTTFDFVYISIKGQKQTRAQAIAGMKGMFTAVKGAPKIDCRVVSARKAEGGLIFVQDTTIVGKADFGKPAPSTIESRTREEVLFVPKGKGWLAKRMKILKDSTVIDGKTIGSS